MAKKPEADLLTGYELSRNWFDWCYENPDLISPTHTAMYFFIIDHWNRLGQKDKFGLPMEMTKDALGIKNYRTFSKVFGDLTEWGFIKIIQRSKNQYSANVIALAKNTKATTKALTKAMQKQLQKQVHGIVGVIEPNNKGTIEPIKEKEKPLTPEGEFKTEVILDSKETEEDRFLKTLPDGWTALVKYWLNYKKEKGQKYKGQISLKPMFDKLWKFSGGDIEKAAEIIENSISNNYSGFFELNKTQNGKIGKNRTVAERSGELNSIISAVFAKKRVAQPV